MNDVNVEMILKELTKLQELLEENKALRKREKLFIKALNDLEEYSHKIRILVSNMHPNWCKPQGARTTAQKILDGNPLPSDPDYWRFI